MNTNSKDSFFILKLEVLSPAYYNPNYQVLKHTILFYHLHFCENNHQTFFTENF